MTTLVADTSTVLRSVEPAVPSGLTTASGPISSSSGGALTTFTSVRESDGITSVPQVGRKNMTPVRAICG